jgi:hypothetical protein
MDLDSSTMLMKPSTGLLGSEINERTLSICEAIDSCKRFGGDFLNASSGRYLVRCKGIRCRS